MIKSGLSGKLPHCIMEMRELETLDLSFNSFSGTIPQKWEIQSLTNINLSNNLFVGQVPPLLMSLPGL